ncbi:MAG TPA: HAD family hydrolase [Acidimicrobiales bacterium]|nr:HAD family hydrolase [Acidimicrobiales bacterium]
MSARDPISLVATDLDETLWIHGVVPLQTRVALATLTANDVPVLAATARRPGSTLNSMRTNEIMLPTVLFNGSLGLDFESGDVFHSHVFESHVSLEVLDILSSVGIEPCVNIQHPTHDVVVGKAPSTSPRHLAFIAPWLQYGDLRGVAINEPVLSIGVCGREHELMLRAQRAVGTLAATTVSRDADFGEFTLSIRPFGVTKWEGVLAYCRAHGIDDHQVLAVGDGQNDVELLCMAAVSCASIGACDEVLAIANYRLDDFPDGGWHSIVELIL